MKVFLTGGTGSIGKAILANLLAHNHQVTCIVKDAASHASLQSAFPSVPNLTIVDHSLSSTTGAVLTALSTGFDCIIHTAQSFLPDGHHMEEVTLQAFIAAGKATAASGRPCHFITTTTTATLGDTGDRLVDELGSTEHPYQMGAWRVPLEKAVLEAGEGTFTTAIVRPVWVYGTSFVDQWIRVSKEKRQVICPNAHGRCGMVHKDDIAELYRLIMEQRATGLFIGCEPRPVLSEEVIAKMHELLGAAEFISTDEPLKYISEYGFFMFGLIGNQQLVPRRSMELGWQPHYAFLEAFNQLYSS